MTYCPACAQDTMHTCTDANAPLTFARLQDEQHVWAVTNFGDGSKHGSLLGAMEEAGELEDVCIAFGGTPPVGLLTILGRLAHAHLKNEQGIRGIDRPKFESLAEDAVGDILIYLADYCSRNHLDFQHAAEVTWRTVSRRDWVNNPVGAAQ